MGSGQSKEAAPIVFYGPASDGSASVTLSGGLLDELFRKQRQQNEAMAEATQGVPQEQTGEELANLKDLRDSAESLDVRVSHRVTTELLERVQHLKQRSVEFQPDERCSEAKEAVLSCLKERRILDCHEEVKHFKSLLDEAQKEYLRTAVTR